MSDRFQGQIQDRHPFEVLAHPWRNRLSGVLTLERGVGRRTLYYHQGELIQADSTLPKESLLHALEARGTIDASLRARAEAASQESPFRAIQVLVDERAVTPDEVRTLLRRRTEQLVAASLTWKDGSFAFHPTPGMPPLPGAPVKTSLPRVLLLASSRYLPQVDVESQLSLSLDLRPKALGEMPIQPQDLGLTPSWHDFLLALDGLRTLSEVLDFSALPREEAGRAVFVLERLGMIKMEAAAPSRPARPLPPLPPRPSSSPVEAPGGAAASLPPRRPPAEAPRPSPPPLRADPPSEVDSGARGGSLNAESLFGPGFAQVKAPPARHKPSPVEEGEPELDDLTGADLRGVRSLMPSDRSRYFEMRERLEKMGSQNFFQWLDIEPTPSEVEIRNAYFSLARRYHPDALQAMAEPIRDAAHALFGKVSEAYETLSDPPSRDRYLDRVVHGKPDENEQAMREVRAIMDAEQSFKRGLKMLNAGKLLEAHTDFTRAVDAYPNEMEYAIYLGWVRFKLYHPKDPPAAEAAEQMIREALKQNSKLDKGWHLLGRIYMAKENWEQAKLFLRQAIKLQPANGEAVRDYKHCDAKSKAPASPASALAGLFNRFKKG